MKLVAVTNTFNERHRYLERTAPALLSYVDEWVVQDDASTDGTPDYLESLGAHVVEAVDGKRWRQDEGALHNRLLQEALMLEPTHVLAIDADEVVLDPAGLRAALEHDSLAYTLTMLELWGTSPPVVRHDGGWVPHEVGIAYSVGPRGVGPIAGKKLASPRVPREVVRDVRRRRAHKTGVAIAHLGWSNPAERERRHARYEELDGGRYHASAHLESILWPDDRCDLRPLDPARVEELERVMPANSQDFTK